MAEAFKACRAASQSISVASNGGRGSQEAADACSPRRRAIRRRHSAVDEGRGGRVIARHICNEFDLPASTVCNWKKNSDKILADSLKAGKKRIRMCHSKYKDIKQVLLYWIKDMRSRDHPPPLSKGILKAKAEQ